MKMPKGTFANCMNMIYENRKRREAHALLEQCLAESEAKKQAAAAVPKYIPDGKPWKLTTIEDNMVYHLSWGQKDVTQDVAAIQSVISRFGLSCTLDKINRGSQITQYLLRPAGTTRYSQILKLSAEFIGALNDNAVRVYQDGAYVVVEVPGLVDTVQVADILRCDEFSNSNRMTVAIGKAIDGKNVLADIEDMPHMLIAGTTGSGKTVFMHGLIVSLLLKHTPSEMELYLVDPKGVEFGCYSQLCMCHMVKRVPDAVMLLNNLCDDMENRYNAIAAAGVRDIDEYNAISPYHMKRKIVFIDELADLMLVSKGSVENSIARLAQKARACGIHLIIATQRPTVNVVTGLIKSNISVRVCFAVPSYRDSMVMLDKGGAEKLLGKGDMLYKSGTGINVVRLQGGFIERKEYSNVVFELAKNQE